VKLAAAEKVSAKNSTLLAALCTFRSLQRLVHLSRDAFFLPLQGFFLSAALRWPCARPCTVARPPLRGHAPAQGRLTKERQAVTPFCLVAASGYDLFT